MSNTSELYTPYQCAKLVNKWFEEKEIDKTLPPQMFYTYVNKGYIKSQPVDRGTRTFQMVSAENLATWFAGYLEKQERLATEKAAKLQKAEVVEAEVTEAE